jgi:hypothetical protein
METAGITMNRFAEKVFSFLMREMVEPSFRFPGGGIAGRQISDCIEKLDDGTGSLSREKVMDFCICQVHAVQFFGHEYLKRWNPSHSFGKKALARFAQNGRPQRRHQDRWLASKGLSRAGLLDLFRDRSVHPLAKFIYPESEDRTKRRHRQSGAGLYVCSVSTLMWTPFSPVCASCSDAETCREMTRRRYPELYRIREEEFKKGGRV